MCSRCASSASGTSRCSVRASTSSSDRVAGAHQAERAARRGLRRDVQHDRPERGAAHPGVADADHVAHAVLQQLARQRHVPHLRQPRIAARAAAAQDEHVVGGDVERGIVQSGVQVLDAVEHHRSATVAHQLGCRGGRLDHRTVRGEVAAQDREPGLGRDRRVGGPDDLRVGRRQAGDLVGEQAARDGPARLQVVDDLAQHGVQPARAVEVLHQVRACGLDVGQQRDAAARGVDVGERDGRADPAGDREQVHHGVGRAADRGDGPHGVAQRRGREDRGRAQVLGHHRDDAVARRVRQRQQTAVGRGQARVARQRHAQRLGDARHGRRGAHRVAVAAAADHGGFGAAQVGAGHPACADVLAHLPDAGAAAKELAVKAAVEHRSAGDHERRQIDRRGAHQQRRHGLVAPAEQHHPVDGVGADQLLDHHRGEVAEEHGRRPQQGLAKRRHGQLQRHPTRLPHPALDVLGDLPEVAVAGREVRPGVADDDLGPAVERVVGQAAAHPGAVDERVAVVTGVPLL